MRIGKRLLVVSLIVVLCYSPPPLVSCGPFFPETIFVFTDRPDLPFRNFAQGELGVLHATYSRTYLVVAYRHLAGTGWDRQEQEAILDAWEGRWKPGTDYQQPWIKEWLEARSKVPGAGSPAQITGFRFGKKSFSEYLNCPEDAFRTAVRTLRQRIEQFHAGSAEVREWVQAQDQVFANCSGAAVIPAPAQPGRHPLIRADRAYQIGAAHFYAGDFDAAEKIFRGITADSSSPWQRIAPYLVARTLIRKATLGAGPDKTDVPTLAQAEAELKKVLADKKLGETHAASGRLLNWVRFRLYPEPRLRELAQTLLKKNAAETLKQDLRDYTLLVARIPIEKPDDMTDWIRTFEAGRRSPPSAALDHSLQKWQETSSLPWLVASLSQIDGKHPRLPELLEAAGKVGRGSPGFLSVAFHRTWLLIERGDKNQARQTLDSLLSSGSPALPRSTTNLFLALRTRVARSLDEFLRDAQRIPAEVSIETNVRKEDRPYFDNDAATALNEGMPLSLLKEAARSKFLAAHLHQQLTLAVWVRSVMLENHQAAGELAPLLATAVPEMKEPLRAYQSAPDSNSRKFAAAFLMLKFPGSRPFVDSGVGRETPVGRLDNLRDNWWCPLDPAAGPERFGLHASGPRWYNWRIWGVGVEPRDESALHRFPDFLDAWQKTATDAEWKTLMSAGAGPSFLSRRVLEWARKNPQDSRVPEALHLAVRATRYGCTDRETSSLSRQAFELLHQRYPNSPWAKKTPYWFK